MKYQYFPGCSLKGMGRAYEESFLAVARALGIEINELEDWNCCGATAYMSIDETKSYALAGRNLAIAERNASDVIAPCSACYLVLNKTIHGMSENPDLHGKVSRALKAGGPRGARRAITGGAWSARDPGAVDRGRQGPKY